MSAWFVGNKAISKLANAVDRDVRNLNRQVSEKLPTDIKQLAQDLYNMNVYSLRERYGSADDMIEPFEYMGAVTYENEHQFYQSLNCYLYQCAEGVVVKTPLYKMMEEIHNALAHKIASDVGRAHGVRWE